MPLNKSHLISAGIVLMCCFVSTRAQQSSVGITPASIDAKVKRSASYTQDFTLSNNTGTSLRFSFSVTDVWYDEHNKRITGRPGTLPRSASSWVQFSSPEVIVAPRSSGVVKMVITVPSTAAGGYYTVPDFEAMPTTITGATSSAAIGVRFHGLMMFTVLEASEYAVEVMGGTIVPPSASAELAIQLDVRNRSTAHVRLRGAFAILNASGSLVGRGAIAEKRYLPDQRDFLAGGWAGELPPGKYTCVVTLSYDRAGMEAASVVHELTFTVP